MIKVVALLRKQSGMSTEEFERRWLVDHTKLSSRLPDCKGYRINLVRSFERTDGADGDLPFDGTAELWWETREAMDQAFASRLAENAGSDIDSFCDLRIHLYCEEYVVIESGEPIQPPRAATWVPQ